MEFQIGCFENCRTIHEKWIACYPDSGWSWTAFAEFENSLEEYEWVRFIYERAILWELDMPEKVWKSYIDFEIENRDFEKAREIYQKLLNLTKNVKVWLSFARFEIENANLIEKSREIFK